MKAVFGKISNEQVTRERGDILGYCTSCKQETKQVIAKI